MSSGSAIYADYYLKAYSESNLEGKEFFQEDLKHLKFYKDGISATVALYDFEDILILKINGKSDASTPTKEISHALSDMPTQLLSGYLPLLYYQNKLEKVFIIGLGSGVSAKVALDFPEIDSVECVEIEPAVVEVNRFFAPYNDNIMEDPRFKMIIADGRNALLASKDKYDVIITEPSNPWIAGIGGSLFTKEYYEICKERMKPEGIICQWVQMYSLGPEDFKMIIRTFYSVFPEGVIWIGREGDLLLLGSLQPLAFDYSEYINLFETNSDFRKALTGIGINTPDEIFTHYITSSKSMDDIMAGILNRDNLPVLEYSAPMSLYIDTVSTNLQYIYTYKPGATALPVMKEDHSEDLSIEYYITMMNFYNTHIPKMKSYCIAEAFSIYPDDFSLNKINILEMIYDDNYILKAEKELLKLIEKNPEDYRWYLELARFYRNQDLPEEAGKVYFKAHLLLKKKFTRILMENNLKKF